MALNYELRATHFPYCLKKQDGGSYVILNRSYKPLGWTISGWVRYDEYPISVEFIDLTADKIAKLDYRGQSDGHEIFLYNDGCVPTATSEDMDAYLQRLSILMSLKTKEQR